MLKPRGRSVSSKSGSADVIEALGSPLDLDPAQVARCVTEIGIGFTFAPNYRHGLRHAAPTADATDLWATSGGGIQKTTFDTARFGLRRAQPGDLAGGEAACNAKVVRSVADGEPGPALDAVLANAAGALATRNGAADTADIEGAFAAGLDQARAAVSSGAAARLLDQWIALACELAGSR